MNWQPIESAPKDGSWVIALVSNPSERYERLAGRAFVIRHEGWAYDYDLGWSLHPGFGGVSDRWFSHWMPLPDPPIQGVSP